MADNSSLLLGTSKCAQQPLKVGRQTQHRPNENQGLLCYSFTRMEMHAKQRANPKNNGQGNVESYKIPQNAGEVMQTPHG